MTTQHPPQQLSISQDISSEERTYVCRHLFDYNVAATGGLLKQPGIDISLVLKDDTGQVMGGVFCDTFLQCLYVDVLWVDERYRGSGYGQA